MVNLTFDIKIVSAHSKWVLNGAAFEMTSDINQIKSLTLHDIFSLFQAKKYEQKVAENGPHVPYRTSLYF